MGITILIFFIILIVLLYQKRVLSHNSQLMNNEKEHQRKLLDASIEIAEQERRKIAANIHDDVGMLLNVLKLNLNQIRKNVDKKEVFDKVVASSFDIIDNSISTIRAIANDLMPSILVNLGLIKSFKELCNQVNLSGTVMVSLVSEVESIPFDKKTELQVYRLIKEILNNTIKHAGPSYIGINIEIVDSRLNIVITHDGKGITTNSIKIMAGVSSGLGLKSILTRAQFINAKLDFNILNSKTSQVVLEVPL